MSWLQLSLVVEQRTATALEELLLASGAVSVTLSDNQDQPILEPGVGETPLWSEVKLTALYEQAVDREQLLSQLAFSINDAGLDSIASSTEALRERAHFENLEDRHWEREWLNHFEPLRCGERLWICPSWQEPPDPGAVNVLLDPGLAFGTGTHETTLLCLQWLDQCDGLKNSKVLDFGCGSGILGIAALLLGAEHCCFVDNDPQALTATKANLEKNSIPAQRYSLVAAEDYSAPAGGYQQVLANILAQPLIDLAPTLVASTAVGGSIVLSGLQANQQSQIVEAYRNNIQFEPAAEQNDWLRLAGVHRAKTV